MNKTVILGIDGWYPQVDGGTNVVLNYREWLKDMYDCYIVAPSYGKKADEEGEKKYCAGVFHNFSLGVPGLSFRNSVPGADRALKRFLKQNRPDVLHAHSPFAICGYFARYAKKGGRPARLHLSHAVQGRIYARHEIAPRHGHNDERHNAQHQARRLCVGGEQKLGRNVARIRL